MRLSAEYANEQAAVAPRKINKAPSRTGLRPYLSDKGP
jgi:hypothetical protein